jgi:hypothetical protein
MSVMKQMVPDDVIGKTKRGLVAPYNEWMLNPPEFAVELLSACRLRAKGYFCPERVTELLAQHRTRRADHGKTLLGVLGVQLRDDLFVRGFAA